MFYIIGDYNTKTNSSQIPDDRQQGFEKLRAPKSLAELNSRLGSFSYFKSYIQNLKKLAEPLLSLAKSEKFYWNKLEAEAFENIKFIIQFKIWNFHVKREEPLFLASDSSQISAGYILFQLTEDGHIRLIKCDSRLLRQSSRNKGAARRELISLGFRLIETESTLRNHMAPILLLSDASLLQLLNRGRLMNNIFAEMGCFIS